MLDWLIQNKTWLFSGIAVSVPIALIGWYLARKKSGGNITQRTRGKNSPAVNANNGNVDIHYGD
ncbi:MAG: hypothetical protein ACL93V_12335 [Candidatus Electrothrix sp. YB6]